MAKKSNKPSVWIYYNLVSLTAIVILTLISYYSIVMKHDENTSELLWAITTALYVANTLVLVPACSLIFMVRRKKLDKKNLIIGYWVFFIFIAIGAMPVLNLITTL